MTGYVVTRWYRAPEVILNWMHYTQTGESLLGDGAATAPASQSGPAPPVSSREAPWWLLLWRLLSWDGTRVWQATWPLCPRPPSPAHRALMGGFCLSGRLVSGLHHGRDDHGEDAVQGQ